MDIIRYGCINAVHRSNFRRGTLSKWFEDLVSLLTQSGSGFAHQEKSTCRKVRKAFCSGNRSRLASTALSHWPNTLHSSSLPQNVLVLGNQGVEIAYPGLEGNKCTPPTNYSTRPPRRQILSGYTCLPKDQSNLVCLKRCRRPKAPNANIIADPVLYRKLKFDPTGTKLAPGTWTC